MAQASVAGCLDEVTVDLGAALLFATHDLALAARLCPRALVMVDGHLVGDGPLGDLIDEPPHPWFAELVAATRSAGVPSRTGRPT